MKAVVLFRGYDRVLLTTAGRPYASQRTPVLHELPCCWRICCGCLPGDHTCSGSLSEYNRIQRLCWKVDLKPA